MSRGERKAMIKRDAPGLSLSRLGGVRGKRTGRHNPIIGRSH